MTSPYLTNPPLTSREKRLVAALKRMLNNAIVDHYTSIVLTDDHNALEAILNELDGKETNT